jgi:uncharacterized iron-regulated membrane protein
VRGFLLQVHRYTGLVTLAFLMVAAATGIPLVFADKLDVALTPELHRVAVHDAPAAPAVVADAVQRLRPEAQITAFPLAQPPGRSLQIEVAGRPGAAQPLGYDQLFVDPYRTQVIGALQNTPGWDRAHIVRGMYFLHYTLLGGDVGRWLMGLVALGWLVGNLVGFYLTLPAKGPFWSKWTPIWTINFKAKWPRVLLDLHRASGLWLFIGVTLLSATSVALNFYSEAFRPIVVALSPPKPTPWDRPAPKPDPTHRPHLSFVDAEKLGLATAHSHGLRLRPAVETYDPDYRLYGVRFTRDGREDYAGFGPVSYYFDDTTGRLAFVDDVGSDSLGQKVLRSLYPLHSGQVGWLPTRILTCILGLSVLEMSITGLIVWWKKRPARVAARKARRRAGALQASRS